MTPETAKAIKDVIAALDGYYGASGGIVYTVAMKREAMEKALHDLVQSLADGEPE